jgi:hypothetical protein
MRRLLVLLALIAVAAPLASPASAAKPTREPLPIDNLVISDVCSFTVTRTVLVNKSFITTYSNGDARITGIFKQRLTNLSTGEFVDLTSPGPVLLDFHPDGSLTEIDYGPSSSVPPGNCSSPPGGYGGSSTRTATSSATPSSAGRHATSARSSAS